MKLYLDIWLQPTKTITELLSRESKDRVPYIPFLIFGISMGLDLAQDIMVQMDLENIFVATTFTIPISILLIFVIFRFTIPFMIRTAGLLWKGAASHRQLAKACSISLIPYFFILIAQLILILTESEISSRSFEFSARSLIILWSFSLLIIGVAKAQKFSYGFALVNIVISYIPFLLLPLLRTV